MLFVLEQDFSSHDSRPVPPGALPPASVMTTM